MQSFIQDSYACIRQDSDELYIIITRPKSTMPYIPEIYVLLVIAMTFPIVYCKHNEYAIENLNNKKGISLCRSEFSAS